VKKNIFIPSVTIVKEKKIFFDAKNVFRQQNIFSIAKKKKKTAKSK
jgi:hypothetical protein